MGTIDNIEGTSETKFQVGINRPLVRTTGTGEMEVRNLDDTGYARLRAATPVLDNDVVTKAYADTLAKPLIVTAQFNGNNALPANTGTRRFLVVSTTGANGTIGDLVFDDGTGAGTATLLPAIEGRCIAVTTSLSGGTVSFDPDSIYIWDAGGPSWIKIGDIGSVTGAVREIRYVISNSATQDSVFAIPAGSIVTSCELKVTTPYSGGATISVGRAGSLALIMTTAQNNPQNTTGTLYTSNQDTAWGASTLVVRTTVGGAPAAGAGVVIVRFTAPNALAID